MVKFRFRFSSEWKRVQAAAKRATTKALYQAGAMIRTTARRSIRKRKGASAPGSPPHTHTNALRKAILFDVDRDRESVIIGPTADIIGEAGAAHEHGEEYYGRDYPERPFMGPAHKKILPRVAELWRDSVH